MIDASVTRPVGGRFYVGMGLVASAIAVAGFGPAAFDVTSRRAPITPAVLGHGVVFAAWLVLFLAQALLVSSGRIALHRRMGYAMVALAAAMVLTGVATAAAFVRRGYDLSGDLVAASEPHEQLVFQLGDLVSFGLLVAFAVRYRRRPEIHKRLMLLGTLGGLMPAALAHVIGHSPTLRQLPPPVILVPLAALYFAGAVHDRISRGRIHPVSLWVPIGLLIWANVRAILIGPSDSWQAFAAWLGR